MKNDIINIIDNLFKDIQKHYVFDVQKDEIEKHIKGLFESMGCNVKSVKYNDKNRIADILLILPTPLINIDIVISNNGFIITSQ